MPVFFTNCLCLNYVFEHADKYIDLLQYTLVYSEYSVNDETNVSRL